MDIDLFLKRLKNGEAFAFQQVLDVIHEHYDYAPTQFNNGLDADRIVNAAGSNEGSCKLFYFAKLHGLTEAETLGLFGDYYRLDVLNHPEGQDHANIRTFMKHGWAGIVYEGEALKLKS